MRLLTLSVAGVLVAAVAAAQAQSTSSSSDVTQLPVGQIYKDPSYPFFDTTGQLKFTLTAQEAKGITVNRAEMTDLKIDLYTNGKVTTNITSPDADIYVADKKMRTNNTVKITRADSIATAKFCDFDLAAKQYTLRDHVKVVLLHFDMKTAAPGQSAGPMGVAPAASGSPPHAAPSSTPAASKDSLLESPGSYSSTNNAPLPH
jgi:lipopolysaccharide export system protein LptC